MNEWPEPQPLRDPRQASGVMDVPLEWLESLGGTDAPSDAGPPEPPAPPAWRPYGPWATIGLVLAMIAAQVVLGVFLAIVLLIMGGGLLTPEQLQKEMLAPALIASIPLQLLLLWAFLRPRIGRPTKRVLDYLAITEPVSPTGGVYLLMLLGLLAVQTVIEHFVGTPPSQFMYDVWHVRGPMFVALMATVIIGAPLAEEAVFRGFMFRGLLPWGRWAAVVVPAVCWALIHVQYDLISIGWIFVLGLFLGFVRLRTQSTTLCMVLHMVTNIIALMMFGLSMSSPQG